MAPKRKASIRLSLGCLVKKFRNESRSASILPGTKEDFIKAQQCDAVKKPTVLVFTAKHAARSMATRLSVTSKTQTEVKESTEERKSAEENESICEKQAQIKLRLKKNTPTENLGDVTLLETMGVDLDAVNDLHGSLFDLTTLHRGSISQEPYADKDMGPRHVKSDAEGASSQGKVWFWDSHFQAVEWKGADGVVWDVPAMGVTDWKPVDYQAARQLCTGLVRREEGRPVCPKTLP